MSSAFLIAFLIAFTVPLVLCLNAMGRQIRADYQSGQPDRIAADVQLQRRILISVSLFLAVSLLLRHWMIGLTGFLTGVAFLLPYWLNPPADTGKKAAGD
jgi:hypothetical protein